MSWYYTEVFTFSEIHQPAVSQEIGPFDSFQECEAKKIEMKANMPGGQQTMCSEEKPPARKVKKKHA